MMDESTSAPYKECKSLVLITGASRGIGRAIALAIADTIQQPRSGDTNDSTAPASALALSAPLHLVLIARSVESLRETSHLVEQRCGGSSVVVTTSCHEMDLSDLDTLSDKLTNLLEQLKSTNYDHCWLINNAGSLGPLGLASSLDSGASSLKAMQNAVDLNVTSGLWVSSQFAKTFLSPVDASSSLSKKCPVVRIVNISSLCAIEPFPTMAVYCAGKAARDMFHSVLAKENSPQTQAKTNTDNSDGDDGNTVVLISDPIPFKVLNYAPGACDTKMTDVLAECSVLDKSLHQFFSSSREEQTLVKVEDTAKKLIGLLEKDKFQSGEHVDFWDV